MIGEIRIYVEGGGDSSHTKARLRRGLNAFFSSLRNIARSNAIEWAVVATGSRNCCFDDFRTALRYHPRAFNVLLVDAECAVSTGPRQHLRNRDGWDIQASEENCHLMVQTMEAWLIADLDALRIYYGDGFLDSAIPGNPNVEQIDKATLESALDRATQGTQKGKYMKIRHGTDLLARIDPNVVRRRAMHCDRIFQTLESLM